MKRVRLLPPLVAASLISGCAAAPTYGPPFVVVPGAGKDQVAFQQDSQICQQHAMAQTGYGAPAQASVPGAPAGSVGSAGTGLASADASFLQCMAARGDTVVPAPTNYAAGYPGYPYGYAYPYGLSYPYPFYLGGFFGGIGYGGWGHHGWGYGGRGHGGWGHGGWGHGGVASGGGRGGGHR